MRPGPLLLALSVATALVAAVAFDAPAAQAGVLGLGVFAILRVGWAIIAGLAQPVPEPPDPGELRKVKLSYRCAVCGAEVRMTVAASEDPDPPRHCMEDMEVVAPIE